MSDGYYKTKESVDQYIKLAEGHHGGALIERLKGMLQANSSLLEIGSGPGTDWEILNETFETTGSDFSSEFLSRLIVKHPKAQFLELDATTLSTDQKFDGIYSNKVMHHLNDMELKVSVKRQHEILNPQGIICHSFWTGEDSEIFKGLFVNYHSESSLHSFFDNYFEILLLEYYAEFENEDSVFMIGRKK